MHQYILLIFYRSINKHLNFPEKWQYFLVLAVLCFNKQVPSCKAQFNNTVTYLLLIEGFLVHDCDNSSNAFFVDTLAADGLLTAEINIPKRIVLVLQPLVILNWVLGLKDEV